MNGAGRHLSPAYFIYSVLIMLITSEYNNRIANISLATLIHMVRAIFYATVKGTSFPLFSYLTNDSM